MIPFSELGLQESLLKAIEDLGFETPSEVQEKAIPLLLADHIDLVALAQTGTGKTAAFGFPLIQRIDPSSRTTQGLILSPTRELCLQITTGGRVGAGIYLASEQSKSAGYVQPDYASGIGVMFLYASSNMLSSRQLF